MNRIANGTKRIVAMVLAAALLLACAPAALAESFTAVVTAASMQVYRDEDLSQKLGTLNRYSVVRVSGYSEGIARITFNGITGYAMSADMDNVADVGKKALLVANTKIYSSPNRKSQSTLGKKGLRMYVLAASNGWAMVERNSQVGYVEIDRLVRATDDWKVSEHTDRDEDIEYQASASSGSKGKTYTARINMPVYSLASTTSARVGTLKKYTQVSVLQSNKTWAYIKVGKNKGFCLLKYLQAGAVSNTPKSVAASKFNKLPVYKSASVKSKKLGTLKKGQNVYLIRWNSQWAYIELSGHRGYTATAALQAISNVTPVTPVKTPETPVPSLDYALNAVVSASSATVYRSPSSGAGKLGTLKKGAKLRVLAGAGQWAQVFSGKQVGYCLLSALTIAENKNRPKGFKNNTYNLTVVYPGARIYAYPNTAAKSAALGLGSNLRVAAIGNGWARVSYGKGYGYVALSQMSNRTYAEAKSGSGQLVSVLKALLTYGFYDGPASNVLSNDAQDAIKRFQAACGLQMTGEADLVTQRILFSGYAPRSSILYQALGKGASGTNIVRLQNRLFSLAYLSRSASIDGNYGTTTANAVGLFQRVHGLMATGTADLATLRYIYSTAAKVLPASVRAADAGTGSTGGSTTYMTYMPGNTGSTVRQFSPGLSNAKKLEYAIYVASTKLTCPYVYGAVGPNKFDCSGLTTYCMKQIGISLQRTAYQQGYDNSFPKIEAVTALRRGDLVFFNTVSDSDLCDHVGIYLGDGYFIHASSGGHKVVVSQLVTGYYNRVFSWGRRLLK